MRKGFALPLIIFFIITLFAFLFLVYIFVINKTGNTSKSEIKAEYSIPPTLIYQSKKGWTEITGTDWSISLKDKWHLEKKQNHKYVYFNNVNGQPLYVLIFDKGEIGGLGGLSVEISGNKSVYSDHVFTLNNMPAGAIFNKEVNGEYAKLLVIDVGVKKNNSIRTIQIATTDKFFNENKDDLMYLISSYR